MTIMSRRGRISDLAIFFRVAELLDQGDGLPLQATKEAAAGTATDQLGELVGLLRAELFQLQPRYVSL